MGEGGEVTEVADSPGQRKPQQKALRELPRQLEFSEQEDK